MRVPLWSGRYHGWLAAKHATHAASHALSTYYAGTPVLAYFYALCGAAVAPGVVLDSGVEVDDPKFVAFGERTACRAHSRISGHFVDDGELVLAPAHLGAGAELRPRSAVGAGGVVPDDHVVDALAEISGGAEASAGDVFPRGAPLKAPGFLLQFLQYFIGVPFIAALESVATYGALRAVEVAYATVSPQTDTYARIAVVAAVAVWLFRLCQAEAFYALVAITKVVVIGRFRPGPKKGTTLESFRTWLFDRLVHHPSFCGATEPRGGRAASLLRPSRRRASADDRRRGRGGGGVSLETSGRAASL